MSTEHVEALRKLTAEVGGLKAFEPGVREAIGNTNWTVLMQRLDEAVAALSRTAQAPVADGVREARRQAIEEVLGLLTGHELYRYRPKAFNGFIEYARTTLASSDPTPATEAGGAAMPADAEWYQRKAALEGDHEIGVGKRLTSTINSTPEEIVEFERLALEALPKWAQDEIRSARDALRQSKPLALPDGWRAAKYHAVELEQCSIFAADIGQSIAKAMTDAAAFLRSLPVPSVGPNADLLREKALQAAADANGGYIGPKLKRIANAAINSILAASPLPSSSGTGWRPIETAPHGVEVLLATPPFRCMGEQARWEMRVGCASWGERIGGFSNRSQDAYATHWMPLPSAPVSHGGAE